MLHRALELDGLFGMTQATESGFEIMTKCAVKISENI
jgi:hypothetical protein